MENLFIKSKYNTPEIKFDANNGNLKIKGRSHPENADIEFEIVLDWIERYIKAPNQKTTMEIDLEYFNSTSAKILITLLEILTDGKDKTDLKIKWFYYDEDTYETALDFQELIEHEIDYFKQ